jgi:predicted metalloprotease with PDZ domain
MNHKTLAAGVLGALLILPLTSAEAQRSRDAEERARGRGFSFAIAPVDRDRPRLGVTTESSGDRDTLGLLVTYVTPDGPAAKAGLKEGDRLQSVNGVNLRLAREDAGERDMEGVALRRLIRTLEKAKIGDEVEVRVWSDGGVKTLKVKTASVEDLEPRRDAVVWRDREDRAAIGIGIGLTGSRRDTLGIMIASLSEDGPAEKAGLIEGDRIQSINGVDLRVPREDAGDWAMANARARRLTRELEKLKPGDDVELRIYSGGSTRTVRLKAVSAGDIQSRGFFFGDMPGGVITIPRTPGSPRGLIGPGMQLRGFGPEVMQLLPRRQDEWGRHFEGMQRPLMEGRVLPRVAPRMEKRRSAATT